MLLSENEWINLVNSLYNRILDFEHFYFPQQWKKSEDLSYKHEDEKNRIGTGNFFIDVIYALYYNIYKPKR